MRRWVAAKSFLTVSRPPPAPLESFISFAAPRACPRSKTSAAPPALQQLQQKNLPSTSRWVAAFFFSYGFETAACPPRKLQILRSASRLPWLLQKPLTSNLRWPPSTRRWVAAKSFLTVSRPPPAPLESFISFAAPRACPRSKTSAAPPALQQLQQKNLPSTSRWVAAKSFLTVSRPPPAPLESFKSFAAPRACPRSKTSAAPPALQQLQQKNLPSTSRWVAAKSFLTVSRPPPAPLETFKSFAAPRACSGSCKSLTSNLRRASIHAPPGGRKVFSYGFETAACPPRKLHILRSASSLPPLQNLRSDTSLQRPVAFPALSGLSGCDRVLGASSGSSSLLPVAFHTAACACPLQKPLTSNLRRASIHAPLGGRKVFSYGFETAACPPRKLQILRSASSLPPLQNLRSASSPSTAPTKKPSIHEPLGGRKVFSYGFETAACLESFKSFAAPRACPGSCKSLYCNL